MAEQLKRQYDLTVLKVSLNPYGQRERSRVRFALEEAHHSGTVDLVGEYFAAPEDLGLPGRFDRSWARSSGGELRVPPEVVHHLQNWLAPRPESTLWLHLVKPCGYLGLVPWEALLQSEGVFPVPILRLPDFIVPPPRETQSILDVVLCGSMPRAKYAFDLPHHLPNIALGIRKGLDSASRRMRFHVFVDRDSLPAVRKQFAAQALGPDIVRFYDPSEADQYESPERATRVADASTRIGNPWLLWIRDALSGRSVDVAHFLCHGYFSGDRGALAVSETPVRNEDRYMARFIGAGELATFLTQIGAWATAFTSPFEDYSPLGLRLLADTVGQTRPGSVLFHELPRDPECKALGRCYDFLFAHAPRKPPVSGAVFMYCQPYRVASAVPAPPPLPDEGDEHGSAGSTLSTIYEEEENVPGWLAASQRFVEQSRADLDRFQQSSIRRTDVSERSESVARDTLRQIQEIVAEVAQAKRSGGAR